MTAPQRKRYALITISLLALIAALLVVIVLLISRTGPDKPSVAPPPPPQGALKMVKGVVKGFGNNVHLDINSLQLDKSGEGKLLFEFRPHTAQAVWSVARPGDSVVLAYDTRPNDEAIVYQLHRIRNLRTQHEADLDRLPPPPRIPPGQRAQTFEVGPPQVITDSYGGVAALQSSGKLFHFKPEQVEDIQGLIKQGRHFTLMAVRRGDDQGFINIHHDQVYLVISITIDSKTFIIR